MAIANLTVHAVRHLSFKPTVDDPDARCVIHRDRGGKSSVPGLGARVTRDGARSYVVQFRVKGSRRQRIVTLDDGAAMGLDAARRQVKRVNEVAATGKDWFQDNAAKHANRLGDVWQHYDKQKLARADESPRTRKGADSLWRCYCQGDFANRATLDITADIAGITFRRFCFRLVPGAIKGPQILEFLHALGQQIRQPLLVIWDRLPAHRSSLVRDYLEALRGAIKTEQLPAYAPELNPTE